MDKFINGANNVLNKVVKVAIGDVSLFDIPSIERPVIDSSVSLGFLYNAWEDSVVGKLNPPIKLNTKDLQNKIICNLLIGNEIQHRNLLQNFQIDDETHLSITLNMITPKGITSIIEYSTPISDFTRVIYYIHHSRNDLVAENVSQKQYTVTPFRTDCIPTHLITKIKWGIGVIIILQLASVDSSTIKQIDDVLKSMCSQLNNQTDIGRILPREEKLLRNICSTKVYSNSEPFNGFNNIHEICQRIQIIKRNRQAHRQLSFKMHPIAHFFPHSELTQNIYKPIDTKYIERIEKYFFPLSFQIKTLEEMFDIEISRLLHYHIGERLDLGNEKLQDLKNDYLTKVKIFQDLVIQIRSGRDSQAILDQLLSNQEQRLLQNKLDDVTFYFNNLRLKKDLFINLYENQIDYLNVQDTNVNQNDTQHQLKDKLFEIYPNTSILCSSDFLLDEKKDQYDRFLLRFLEQRKNNNNLNLLYADFTYCTYNLKDFDILKPEKINDKKINITKFLTPLTKTLPKPESTINILLFGESGVGKSTFINAFANYLLFKDIDEARNGKLNVIIPVSFVMTINDQFEEKSIEFGHQDPNENHNDSGQSVTQQCKSYEFKTDDGKMLKLIDTPGFGDSRGQDQDDKNLNQIFSFIENLAHLNALCILLKPNVKELNPVFRTSFLQLLQHLGDHFYNNIFFCFTNSQSTFFTIGDTGPVLNKFLQAKQIRLEKENTFCFDSESFRYLIASQQSIEFDQQFIEQFEQSWLKSVKESKRLVDRISSKDQQNNINQKWMSTEQIKEEIKQLIRPVLEALRNISTNELSNKKQLQRSVSVPVQKTDYSSDDANAYLFEIIKACAIFDQFLKDDYQNPPFLNGINRIINEEKSLGENDESNNVHKKVFRRLEECKEQYLKTFNGINLMDECLHLKKIDSRIEGIKQMPIIYEQLNRV